MDRIEMAKWGSRIAAILMLLIFLLVISAMQGALEREKARRRTEIGQDDDFRKSRKGKHGKDDDELPDGYVR